jgi:hypothetical protein
MGNKGDENNVTLGGKSRCPLASKAVELDLLSFYIGRFLGKSSVGAIIDMNLTSSGTSM